MEEISNAELLIRLLNEIKKESDQIRKELKDEIQKINVIYIAKEWIL